MSDRKSINCRSWMLVFALITIAIGVLGLIGTVLQWANLTAWGTDAPMAPSTAVALICVGLGQVAHIRCCTCH